MLKAEITTQGKYELSMEVCTDRLIHSHHVLDACDLEGYTISNACYPPILRNADGYQKEMINRKSLQSAMIVPTKAITRAPHAPIPLRFAAPLEPDDVLVAAAPLP